MRRPVVSVDEDPAESAVSLAEMKLQLRVHHDDEDASIQAFVDAATELLDGPTGRLNAAIVEQTWKQVSDGSQFAGLVWLAGVPTSIVSIDYLDTDEQEQTASVDDFRLASDGFRWAVTPVRGKTWPSLADREDALTIRYRTGVAPAKVPKPIKQAIKLLASHWFNEREGVAPVEMREVPFAVSALVDQYRRGVIQ